MQETLLFLTQMEPPRNYKNIESLNRVAHYIKSRFEALCIPVEYQEFMVSNQIYKNVIASINPHCEKRLIMGGHYDVCGDIQGADDNASAIAGLLQSAKLLKNIATELNFRIDFVAFCLEEPPYFGTQNMGSFIHAKYLQEHQIPIIGMINYEMIGYFTDEPNSQNYPIESMKNIYPSTGDFIAMISNENSQSFLHALDFDNCPKNIASLNIILPEILAPLSASDHLNYWGFGFPAIMVTDTAFFRNPNYHKTSDTMDTLNIAKMEYVVDLIVSGIKKITNNTKT